MLDLPDEPAPAIATFGTVRDPVTGRRRGTRAGKRWATGYQGLPDGYASTISAVEAADGHSTVLIYDSGS